MFVVKPSIANYAVFSQLRAECKRLSKECFSNYVVGIDLKLKDGPRSFWKYINDKMSSHRIPDSLFYGDQSACEGQGIVDLFKELFQTVYAKNTSSTDLELIDNNIGNNIICTEISKTDIFDELLSFQIN